ncbi:hypothetical protein KP509_12G096600 [Ceratopteris richardii]|uniref:G-patch domain-containing protein n=1 Tax=Ceratopteris richardii TaxID=49495 RepID=A0A8T2TUQ8_CERRI|nr:hypothetical protein KP509_12G096600 [Ceratopteris richardii]
MAAPEAPVMYQGVSRSSAAFRLLKQMGWQEGEGLGKDKQGIKEHVRVAKKKDNSGVGVDAKQKAASNWTLNTDAFDRILKNLNVIAAGTDTTVAIDEKYKQSVVHDGDDEAASPPKKVTRPQGRYKKRELGKLLKGKSEDDINAILGFTKARVKGVSENSKSPTETSALYSSTEVRIQTLSEDGCTSTVEDIQPSEDISYMKTENDWWGARFGFVRAGALGAQACMRNSLAEVSKTRSSFCEQDQENLYKLVQDKATKGRQGLGIADRPRKIGGAHWKGQKVLLDSDDCSDVEDGSLPTGHKNATKIADLSTEVHEHEAIGDSSDYKSGRKRRREPKFKWKKLCRALLQEAPAQTMKIKHLHRYMIEVQNGSCRKECMGISFFSKEDLKEKLLKSSKFCIEGRRVSLITSS